MSEKDVTRKILSLILILSVVTLSAYPLIFSAEAKPDSPIAGATIIATSQVGSGYNVTMPNGSYILTQGLAAGTYNVTALALGYISKTVGGVSVQVGATTSNINFNLTRSGGISGKVTDSTTSAGISGIVVTAYSHNLYSWFGLTDSNGNYRIITNLATGTYNVTVFSAPGYMAKTVSGVSVTAGGESTNVNLALTKSAIISGKVLTTSGQPVPGISVTAISSDGGSFVGSAVTGPDGSYRITSGLGLGTYIVNAYSGTSFAQVPNISVVIGQETPNVNLTLNVAAQPTGAISGRVIDENNNPVVGAGVSAGSGQAKSDQNGNYQISSGLPTGNYTVTVIAAGYGTQNRTSIGVTEGSVTPGIDFKLVRTPASGSGRISGRVTGEDNPLTNPTTSITCAPVQTTITLGSSVSVSGAIIPDVSGATVKIVYKLGSTNTTRTVTTGSDGKYNDAYTPTAAGSWTVQASWSGNTEYLGASSAASSFTVSQPVTTGGILVAVTDSSGTPVVGATVSSTSTPSGQSALTGVSGSDGFVKFTGIAAGSYTFSASKTGYATTSGTMMVVAGTDVNLSIALQTQSASTGGIKVTVLDANNNALSGATVSSTTAPSGQNALNGVTATDGTITFNAVTPGSYTIQAALNGYTTNTGAVNVVAGSVQSLSITLQTQPSSGIPGYPVEAILVGMILITGLLIMIRRRS
jgi:protocatechuate 3,4-dioxygenase beta subunit